MKLLKAMTDDNPKKRPKLRDCLNLVEELPDWNLWKLKNNKNW